MGRPVRHHKDPVKVSLKMGVYAILDVVSFAFSNKHCSGSLCALSLFDDAFRARARRFFMGWYGVTIVVFRREIKLLWFSKFKMASMTSNGSNLSVLENVELNFFLNDKKHADFFVPR